MTGHLKWPADGEKLIKVFLGQANCATKSAAYRIELREFHQFVLESVKGGLLTRRHLRRWLRDRQAKVCRCRVIGGARIVRRFLDWLIHHGATVANPISSLCTEFECRSVAAIARALLGPKSNEALQALRPLPRYGSHLGSIMQEHVARMRTLGYRYRHESRYLHFDRYLQQRPNAARQRLEVLISEYAAAAPSAHERLTRLSLGRVLAKALLRKGFPAAMVKADRILVHEARRKRRRPFIYSPEQVQQLLQAALAYPAPSVRAPLRRLTLYTMVAVAYCAGLRLGEIVNLQVRDIDLKQGIIEVRETKFFKSRRLPLSASAVSALRDYLNARSKSGASPAPQAPLFVHPKGGYSYVAAGTLLRDIIRRAGLHTGEGRAGARFHDLRHTFAVHRMTQWYRDGVNPQGKLMHLAAYLGHVDIHSTLIYLTITQELLQQANSRFRSAAPGILKAIKGEH